MERKRGMVDEEFREHMRPRMGKEVPVTDGAKIQEAPPRPRKKKKLWIVLLLILLVVGAAAALYFTGVLQSWLNVDFGKTAVDQTAAIAAAQQEIDTLKQALDERESELDRRENELEERSSKLDALEQANMTFREYQESLSEEEVASIKQVSTIYSKMSPESAAEIIEQMSDRKRAALIVYNMSSSAAAAIMDAMTPEQAVELTAIMTD